MHDHKDITQLILDDNPPLKPYMDSAFYSFLLVSDTYKDRATAIVDYLNTLYDFDTEDLITREYGVQVLSHIYNMYWKRHVGAYIGVA